MLAQMARAELFRGGRDARVDGQRDADKNGQHGAHVGGYAWLAPREDVRDSRPQG